MISPGTLDVTGWSPTALRVLKAVCIELAIDVETSIHSLALSFKDPETDQPDTTSVHIRPQEKRKKRS
jgi:hypothetical protein